MVSITKHGTTLWSGCHGTDHRGGIYIIFIDYQIKEMRKQNE